jgi:hypothetical protein
MRSAAMLVGLLLALSPLGCGEGTIGEGEGDGREVMLNPGDFDAAVRHLAELPYLPWHYTVDGCYARALYFSMTLATMRVPSRHVYCVARANHTIDGVWGYHVAPMVSKDADPDQLYVLDPLFDPAQAMPLTTWVERMDPSYTDPAATAYPALRVAAGNSYGSWTNTASVVDPQAPRAADYREPSFAAMPAFATGTINDACRVMHRYIDIETSTTADEKLYKHRVLGERTEQAMRQLLWLGKLQGWPSQIASDCRGDVGSSKPRSPNWTSCSSDTDCTSSWCGCNSGAKKVCLPSLAYPKTCVAVTPNWASCTSDTECTSRWCGCNYGATRVCLPGPAYPKDCLL